MVSETALEKAGLTRVEAKIYLAVLNLGPSLAGQISKHSGVHRRSVYDALDRLVEKGIISYIIKNNRRYFQASNPNKLIDLIREKEEEIKNIVPELQSLFAKTKAKEETMFFRGVDGLKTVFEDQLREGKEILVLGASSQANEILRFYFKWYSERRKEKHIKIRIIADTESRGKIKSVLSEIRYISALGPAATNIYADKVAIILWSKERPLAIIIKNKEIADSYRLFFEHMWKIAKK